MVASFAASLLIPEPNMVGCPYAGPCHYWPHFLKGFVFILVCVVVGPRKLPYQLFVIFLVPALGLVEPANTGELRSAVLLVLLHLPWDYIVQGGVAGVLVGHGIIYCVDRIKNASRI